MKKEKVQTFLISKEKEKKRYKVGESYVVFYFQEGKRLGYYSGNLFHIKDKKKGLSQYFFYRKGDRSLQIFFLQSPSVLKILKGERSG